MRLFPHLLCSFAKNKKNAPVKNGASALRKSGTTRIDSDASASEHLFHGNDTARSHGNDRLYLHIPDHVHESGSSAKQLAEDLHSPSPRAAPSSAALSGGTIRELLFRSTPLMISTDYSIKIRGVSTPLIAAEAMRQQENWIDEVMVR
jgi:hypothetical protein